MTITNGMRPIHPGDILREEFIIPLLSANARSSPCAYPHRASTTSHANAARSARHYPAPGTPLGTRAAFWLGLQSDCGMKIALAEHGSRINRDIVSMEQAA
mgnify:CR=1 FL=1